MNIYIEHIQGANLIKHSKFIKKKKEKQLENFLNWVSVCGQQSIKFNIDIPSLSFQ